jgi:hypothetical protein
MGNAGPTLRRCVRVCAALLLVPAGCTRHDVGGQTIARVNGEPITQDDVALELALAGTPRPGRAAVVQALIDRTLLAQEARARGEERTADFVRLERRWHTAALAARDAAIVAARSGPTEGADAALARHRAALRAGADIVVAGP